MEGRGLWFLQLGLRMQQERFPSAPLGKDLTRQNTGCKKRAHLASQRLEQQGPA